MKWFLPIRLPGSVPRASGECGSYGEGPHLVPAVATPGRANRSHSRGHQPEQNAGSRARLILKPRSAPAQVQQPSIAVTRTSMPDGPAISLQNSDTAKANEQSLTSGTPPRHVCGKGASVYSRGQELGSSSQLKQSLKLPQTDCA